MVTASGSLEVSATARPNRHFLRFGLSTLIGVVVLAAIVFASLRPKPKPVLISHHNIEYPANLDQKQKAAAKRLSELIEENKLVGTKAIELFDLAYATRIDITSERVQYDLALDQPNEGGKVVIVIVDARTGIVTRAYLSVYMY